jgi:hypothetical protein
MTALAYSLSSKTSIELENNAVESIAVDGTPRYVDFGGEDWYTLKCEVEGLSPVERDDIVSFINSNRTSDIDVTINGTIYRGKIIPTTKVRIQQRDYLSTINFSMRARTI